MGLSTKKTTTKQTTTPTVTEPYNTAFQDFTGQIGDFLATDPTQYVAPTSALQTQAFADAQNLGGWEPYLQKSANLATGAANAPASQVTAYGYNAPTIQGAYTMGGTQLGPANTFGGAQLGEAAQAQAAQLGPAQGYELPELSDAALASAQGLLGDPHRLSQYMQDYQNPYTQQVIDATLADYDQYAGQRRASMAADAGKTAAFGGSRYGIAEGQLEGEIGRGRATTQANLLDQQYRLAAQLAGVDAGAANQFDLQNAGMGLQTALANQGYQNQFALSRYGAGIDQSRYGADMANQFASQNAGYQQQANLANQDAMNSFMMQQGLLDQQTGQINMEALNQFAMQQGLFDQNTDQLNMAALNNFLVTQVGLDADSAKYYADALNQSSYQNANLLEQSYLRDLQASGQLGDLSQLYGQQSIADTGLTAELGGVQRGIASETANAVPTQLQLAGNLYSQLYPGLYSGTNMTGKGTEGGLGSWLPQLAGSAMQAGAVAFSDRRLKSNIVKVGEYADGLGAYEYDIFGQRQRGVMADEVAEHYPEALGPEANGFATVNYGRLMEAINGG